MPNIKDDSTVEAIAREFTSNGRNKTRAMVETGYDPVYSDSGCGQKSVYGNLRVKEAIARIDAKASKKAEFTVLDYQRQLDEDRDLAISLKQPSAAVSASVAKGRSCGYDRDAGIITHREEPIPDADKLILEEAARALKLKLA